MSTKFVTLFKLHNYWKYKSSVGLFCIWEVLMCKFSFVWIDFPFSGRCKGLICITLYYERRYHRVFCSIIQKGIILAFFPFYFRSCLLFIANTKEVAEGFLMRHLLLNYWGLHSPCRHKFYDYLWAKMEGEHEW